MPECNSFSFLKMNGVPNLKSSKNLLMFKLTGGRSGLVPEWEHYFIG